MNNVIGIDCCKQEIIPKPNAILKIYKNRHTNTDGTAWGWIEGCTKNICWSDSGSCPNKFNRTDAENLVEVYNAKNR